ncbi:DNA mismatch repair endonuclease MutL [Succinimonas sp.]|uniref:DNA mismatch repair endonuclease MutL n=1 Tax=Succinimonas sp. TaxID=1936151 RepID=UPI003866BE0F
MGIHLLPPQVANQIAAGEVVERPAAVVKELMENALDAGADNISVVIENGGSRLIQVRDNGSGIPKEELPLALKRHATSKISAIEDLDHLSSMGFRGEALASIAAVSRLLLVSHPRNQEMAWSVRVEGLGQEAEILPAAYPEGTSAEVRDLFFNTPARRRFLRSEKTEFLQIEEIFRRLALSRREAAFSLRNGKNIIYDLKKASDEKTYRERLRSIVGNGFLNDLLSFSEERNGLKFSGYVNPAEIPRPCQYFFVNSRIVKDKTLTHAINTAFEEELGEKRSAQYVFFLELDPGDADINVHPQKYEVRFRNPNEVHDFIALVLKNTLRRARQLLPETLEETMNPDPDHGYAPRPLAVNEARLRDLRRESLAQASFPEILPPDPPVPPAPPSSSGSAGAVYSEADLAAPDAAVICYDREPAPSPAGNGKAPDSVYLRLFGNKTGRKEDNPGTTSSGGALFSASSRFLALSSSLQEGRGQEGSSGQEGSMSSRFQDARAQEFSESLRRLSRANPIGLRENEPARDNSVQADTFSRGNDGTPDPENRDPANPGNPGNTGLRMRTPEDLDRDLMPWLAAPRENTRSFSFIIPEKGYALIQTDQKIWAVNIRKLAGILFRQRIRAELSVPAPDFLKPSKLSLPFQFPVSRDYALETLKVLSALGFALTTGLHELTITAVPLLVRGSRLREFFKMFLGGLDEAAALRDLHAPGKGAVAAVLGDITLREDSLFFTGFLRAVFQEKAPEFFSREMTERILSGVPEAGFFGTLPGDTAWEMPLGRMIREHFNHD